LIAIGKGSNVPKLGDFASVTHYDKNTEAEFMEFLLAMIIELMQKMEEYFQVTKKEEETPTRSVLVIFLDNVSGMNQSDWRFLEILQRTEHPMFQYLVLILAIEKD
jgi:hypothetical protein